MIVDNYSPGGGLPADPFAALTATPPPRTPPPVDDHDPFADIDLDAPPRPAMARRPGGSGLDLEERPRSRPPFPPPEESEPSAPYRPLADPARPVPKGPPSLAARVGSWLALVASTGVAVLGLAFAAWTSGVVDLDGLLMAGLEERFEVVPPRSFLGKDDPSPADLKIEAAHAEDRADIAAAAAAWRRVVARAPDDLEAKRKLVEALRALGETRLADEVSR